MYKILLILLSFLSLSHLSAQEINLQKAINIALENNRNHNISKLSLEIAKAQHEQARSALYPRFDAQVNAIRTDEDVQFSLKGDLPLPPAFAALGANSLAVDLTAPVLGRDTVQSSLNMNYTLYSGGKIDALIKQTKLNKKIHEQNIIRKNHEVVFDVKKYFHAYVLSNELHKYAKESHDRMIIIRNLTKSLYQGESLQVKKTDYLKTKVITSLIESTLYRFKMGKELSKSALMSAMGLSYKDNITINYANEYKTQQSGQLKTLVEDAYSFNPMVQQMQLQLLINNEQIREAKSEFYPKVGLQGTVQSFYNSADTGLNNDANEFGWKLAIGVKVPLFDGFRHKYNLMEKRLQKKRNLERSMILKEGVAMQIKHALIESNNSHKQIKILKNAKKVANENTQLNIDGYQIDLISTADVLQAQLTQCYINLDYTYTMYQYQMSLAKIEQILGKAYAKYNLQNLM